MKQRAEIMLWFNDARGVYIPRDFANSFADRASAVSGVDAGQWETLEAGPDHQEYWETWQEVCDNAVITDEHGNKYRVYQDGDCWLIPESYEWSERIDWFVNPENEPAAD